MNTFPLKIVTAGGLFFEGHAQRLVVRTTSGDLGVLAHHINCVAPLAVGQAMVVDAEGRRRYGNCSGGILSVQNGEVNLIPTSFTWDGF